MDAVLWAEGADRWVGGADDVARAGAGPAEFAYAIVGRGHYLVSRTGADPPVSRAGVMRV